MTSPLYEIVHTINQKCRQSFFVQALHYVGKGFLIFRTFANRPRFICKKMVDLQFGLHHQVKYLISSEIK